MNYIIVEEATNKVLLSTDYDLELEAFVEELEVGDVEFTIYEETKSGAWVEAEFYCRHVDYIVSSHGGWEERCENMSSVPGGCEIHRDVF